MTNTKLEGASLKIAMNPKLVEIQGLPEEPISLESGESIEVDGEIKPGVWVGSNQAVHFTSSVTMSDEESAVEQSFPTNLKIKRNASVRSEIRNARTSDGKSYIVRAGSTFSIRAISDYHLDHRTWGPYKIRYSRSSHDKIRPANNSTVGVTLGSWSPGSRHQGTYFQLYVPSELKGTKQWIMLQLTDNGRTIHAPMFYLDIR